MDITVASTGTGYYTAGARPPPASALCAQFDIDAISAAPRWLVHHSKLDADRDDAIIVGASSVAHFQHNLTAPKQGPPPRPVPTLSARPARQTSGGACGRTSTRTRCSSRSARSCSPASSRARAARRPAPSALARCRSIRCARRLPRRVSAAAAWHCRLQSCDDGWSHATASRTASRDR